MRSSAAPLAVLAALVLAPAAALAAPEPTLRTDVPAAFKQAACAVDASGRPDQAWAAGVFDAQIEGRRMSTVSRLPVEREQLVRKARSIARVKRYHGYAIGDCDDGSSWAVAFPSPKGLVLSGKGRVELPTAMLDASCESWRVDFAPAAGGKPRRLSPGADGYSVQGLGDGTLGVTCQPASPRWQGPVLWFLAPVGQGPAAAMIADEALEGAPQDVMQRWVNRVRAAEKLPAVRFTDEMAAEAGILAIDSGLIHNRTLLKRVGESLAGRKVKLLGENRVRGKDPRAMAWLLWNSPRHRDLLLDPGAKVAGISRRDVRGEMLTVLIFGADAPAVTAKAAGKATGKAKQR